MSTTRLTDELSKKYWDARIERAKQNNLNQVILNGFCYQIVPDEDELDPNARGFDGMRFVIYFKDGRRVVTHNLWANGLVPDELRADLPDNADKIIRGMED